MKYKYWHKIININPLFKNELNLNQVVGEKQIINYRQNFINIETGEEYWKYDLEYLFRLPSETSIEDVIKKVKEFTKENIQTGDNKW